MHKNTRNLIGQRFGRLVVLGDSGERYHRGIIWDCQCDCGARCKAMGQTLVQGKKISCGCYQKEVATARCLDRAKHMLSKERIYKTWSCMMRRCYNEKDVEYHNYGGRGITVCNEWHNVITFKSWAMSSGYDDTLSIERIDVNKGYSPDNCTWIPKNMQIYNRRITVRYKGKSLRLLAKELGLDPDKVKQRVQSLNWPVEEALELKEHVFSRERYETSYHHQYYKEYYKRQREKSA